tara:strand:+ start:204 stop:365 length:162 start_codon:yes stop_codon:yes gene_type:complete
MKRKFDNPLMQNAYEYYMTLSVDALAVLALRLRDHMGDFNQEKEEEKNGKNDN